MPDTFVLIADIRGLTEYSARKGAMAAMSVIERLFSAFDTNAQSPLDACLMGMFAVSGISPSPTLTPVGTAPSKPDNSCPCQYLSMSFGTLGPLTLVADKSWN